MTTNLTPAQKRFYALMSSLKAGDVLAVPMKSLPMAIGQTTDECTVSAPVPEAMQVEMTMYICVLQEIVGMLFLSDFAPDERAIKPVERLVVEWDNEAYCLRTMEGKILLWYSEDIMVERGGGTTYAEQYVQSMRERRQQTYVRKG